MALSPYNDNLLILAPKPVDSRWSKFSAGTTRPYNDISEFLSSQVFGLRYPTQLFFIKDPDDENKSILYILDKNKDPQRLIPDVSGLQNKTDNSLNTTSKTIVGGINEVKARADSALATAEVAQEDAEDAYDEALLKIPLAQKGAVGGVPSINKVAITSTISEIRALTADNFVSPSVYVTDIGKEGIFYYDFTDTTSTDNGATIIVTSDGRRLKRPIENTIKAWNYGLKGDGVTDDTVSFFNMLQDITDNTTVDFGGRDYFFDTIQLTNKRFIKFIGNGAIFRGTIQVGIFDVASPVVTMNFTSYGIRFLHTGNTRNCYELANMRGFYIDQTYASGSNVLLYIRPLDKFQHVNRGSITNSHGNCNYLVYADNPINIAPYTGIQMSLGDIEISGNADHVSKITNVIGFGVDGATISHNTFFMDGWNIKSQVKNQNIRLVGSNWVTITGNKLFESGLEGVLMERSTDFVISSNTFAWSGERDVNFGYGIRITGRGYPDSGYMTSTIFGNVFDRVTRSGIRLDELCQRVKVFGNQGMSIGNPTFYYGDGTFPAGDPNVVPAINNVSHFMVEVHANTRYCSVHDNNGDNVTYTFPFDATLAQTSEQMLTHYNNEGSSGIYEQRSRTISSMTDGALILGGTNNNTLNLTSGGTVTSMVGLKNGEIFNLYNGSVTLIIENNSTIQLANNENYSMAFQHTITFQKKPDKIYELNRTQTYPETVRNYKFTRPTAVTTPRDASVSPSPAFDLFYTTAPLKSGIRVASDNNRNFRKYLLWDGDGKMFSASEAASTWGTERRVAFDKVYTSILNNVTKITDFQPEIIINNASVLVTLTLSYRFIATFPTSYEIINPESAVANFIIVPNNVGTAMFIDGVSGAAGQLTLRPGEKVILELLDPTNFITTYRGAIKAGIFVSTANTTDVVTTTLLNTNYPIINYPINSVVSYYMQGMEYKRVTATQWTFIPTNLLT